MAQENRILLQRKDCFESVSQIFKKFRANSELYDVKLVCPDSNGKALQAHKLVISSISSVFKEMLTSNSSIHSNKTNCIFLRGVSFEEASSILDFIYEGETMVKRDHIPSFLAVAEDLKIEGLSSANALANSVKTCKNKANSQDDNSTVVNETDDLSPLFPAPTSSMSLAPLAFNFQSEKKRRFKIPSSKKQKLDLHENTTSQNFQLQKYQSLYDPDNTPETTCQIPFNRLNCRSIESISIKNEFSDPNHSSTGNCNDGKSPTLVEKQPTDLCKKINQTSKNIKNRSRGWKYIREYFHPDSTAIEFEAIEATAICNICEGEVIRSTKKRTKEVWNEEMDVGKFWNHLRLNHLEIYIRQKELWHKSRKIQYKTHNEIKNINTSLL